MIYLVFMLIILAVLILVSAIRISIRSTEEENMYIKASIASMQEFYTSMQGQIEETRRYRHDLANHIQTLEILMNDESVNDHDIQECFHDLKSSYTKLKPVRYVSDSIVNAVLIIKAKQCEEKEISFDWDVEDELFPEIEQSDMVSLLSNLLDNAIEACERIPLDGGDDKIHSMPARRIELAMNHEEEGIRIYVENTVHPEERITFQTKKLSPESHGFGMKIIQQIVDKYHGKSTIEIDQDAHRLKRDILIRQAGSPRRRK